jgi:quinol monooxygenase YgiN
MYALLVALRVRPDTDERFQLRLEPGCRRFDVVRQAANPYHYLFYELYDDDAAFAAHRATPHFARWRETAAECLEPDGGQVNTAGFLLFTGGTPPPRGTR